jgi:DNA-binding response OmpR family regulator
MAKILIVDDSEALVTMLSQILSKEGFEVDSVFSRQELVLNLLSATPDLILMDVRLSGDDGRKICRDLKSNSSYKNIPIILLSGSHELLQSFEDYNADDMIEKPFDMQAILQKISKALNKAAEEK